MTGLVNYFILAFRGTPFMPWDLFSLKTAASVADNYNYTVDIKALLVILMFIVLFWLSGLCDIIVTKKKLRLSVGLISLILLFTLFFYVQSQQAQRIFRFYDKLFTPTTMTFRNGTLVTLILQSKYLSVEKPAGYSLEKADEILASYKNKGASLNTLTPGSTVSIKEELPSIIVIMNEAFSDLNILGDFTTNTDYLPFVHSLLKGVDNTQSGIANVSVLGGNTANSEFEFLTSQSMAFLPQGSIPYQQYLKKQSFSLASYLKDLGYETVAIHPYGASGWQRDFVYPRLGFDTFYSLEDFKNPEKIRKYISDKHNYEKIIEFYEKKDNNRPLFLFNVTMQNHSSYSEEFENFTPSIQVTGSEDKSLSQYLSLLKISDEEIKKLISYFKNQEEKVLLLFFGDHQPTDSVVRDIWLQNNKNPAELSHQDQRLRYQVPFFLWANYDIEEAFLQETSLNYLALRVLRAANLPLSEYYSFLSTQEESFPVISAIQAKDSQQNSYEITEIKEKLADYAILQYYYLFDR
ncbi:MAG: LTA synthase family protein [Lachnospiraceae bacterium]|nr:LTA synthase family protein [Lachnospiraceae bacterium]